MENTRLFLSVAKAAARDASELIMQVQDLDREVSTKSSIADLVTNTDKQAEQTIKEDILTNFPDHGILAEESGVTSSDSAYQWVIDPSGRHHQFRTWSCSLLRFHSSNER